MLNVNDRINVPLTELNFDFARSGGPGGQNVNKVNTKVVMHWRVTQSPSIPDDVRQRFIDRFHRRINKDGDLVVHSQRFRDQGRNVADCISKLREMLLEVAEPPKRRKQTKPSRGAKAKRLREKRMQSEKKQMRKPPSRHDG